ncbi:hypothetical protein Scel_17730 [Streptomyces cellostaticus]|nr:hypothetical protein Scel_17730 [Streptomyces cellostaticus]
MTKHSGADEGTDVEVPGTLPGGILSAGEEPAGGMLGPGADVSVPKADRLRYLDTATRQIARGVNVDETVHELCRVSVPAFADTAIIHLHAPLPVGDDKAVSPGALELHTVDHGSARLPLAQAAGVVRPVADGRLAKVLHDGRPVFGDTPENSEAVAELLPAANTVGTVSHGSRLILAPLHGRSQVLGSVVLIRTAGRPDFTGDDLLVASQLATHTALAIDKGDAVRA